MVRRGSMSILMHGDSIVNEMRDICMRLMILLKSIYHGRRQGVFFFSICHCILQILVFERVFLKFCSLGFFLSPYIRYISLSLFLPALLVYLMFVVCDDCFVLVRYIYLEVSPPLICTAYFVSAHYMTLLSAGKFAVCSQRAYSITIEVSIRSRTEV